MQCSVSNRVHIFDIGILTIVELLKKKKTTISIDKLQGHTNNHIADISRDAHKRGKNGKELAIGWKSIDHRLFAVINQPIRCYQSDYLLYIIHV